MKRIDWEVVGCADFVGEFEGCGEKCGEIKQFDSELILGIG